MKMLKLPVIAASVTLSLTACFEDNTTNAVPNGETPISAENPYGNEFFGTEVPGSENPGSQIPGNDTPGYENPNNQIPGNENPGSQIPGAENPGSENPGTPIPDNSLSSSSNVNSGTTFLATIFPVPAA